MSRPGSTTARRRPSSTRPRTSSTRSAPTSSPRWSKRIRRAGRSSGASSGASADMASFATAVLPSPEEEIWRYSRIDELDLGRFELGGVEARVTGWKPSATRSADEEPAVDVFTELNQDNSEALVLHIPRGIVVAEPIEVAWTRPEDGTVSF